MTFEAWKEFADRIRKRGESLSRSRRMQGLSLAESVGIPDAGCLHNASIDDKLTGWCHNNPHRLKVAKKANYMVSQWAWEPTTLADRIIRRAWSKVNR